MIINAGTLCKLKPIYHYYDNLTVPVSWPVWSIQANEPAKILDYLDSNDLFVILEINEMKDFVQNYLIKILTPNGVVGTLGISKDELIKANE
jgi:hypothetical protein